MKKIEIIRAVRLMEKMKIVHKDIAYDMIVGVLDSRGTGLKEANKMEMDGE